MKRFCGVCLHNSGEITQKDFESNSAARAWSKSEKFEGTVLKNVQGYACVVLNTSKRKSAL